MSPSYLASCPSVVLSVPYGQISLLFCQFALLFPCASLFTRQYTFISRWQSANIARSQSKCQLRQQQWQRRLHNAVTRAIAVAWTVFGLFSPLCSCLANLWHTVLLYCPLQNGLQSVNDTSLTNTFPPFTQQNASIWKLSLVSINLGYDTILRYNSQFFNYFSTEQIRFSCWIKNLCCVARFQNDQQKQTKITHLIICMHAITCHLNCSKKITSFLTYVYLFIFEF